MGLPFRHKETKVDKARNAVTTLAALRVLGLKRTLAIAGAGAAVATALIAWRHSSSDDAEEEPVPGAPQTAPSAPAPGANGMSLDDAAEQARAAAASLAPQGSGADAA